MARILAAEDNLVVVDFGGPGPLLDKKQLAAHPSIRRSVRWIEERLREGMPSTLDKKGRRKFQLSDVQEWLNSKEVANV
jgi:hypothetical protein